MYSSNLIIPFICYVNFERPYNNNSNKYFHDSYWKCKVPVIVMGVNLFLYLIKFPREREGQSLS